MMYLLTKKVIKDIDGEYFFYNQSVVMNHFDSFSKAFNYLNDLISFHYRKKCNVIESRDNLFKYSLDDSTIVEFRIIELGDKELK